MDSAVIVEHFPDCAIVEEGPVEIVRVSGTQNAFSDKARVCVCGGLNIEIDVEQQIDGTIRLNIPTGGRA